MINVVTAPAVGQEWSFTVRPGTKLLAVTFRFVTSAVVANRFPVLILDDGSATGIMARVPSAGNYAAGADRYASFGNGLPTTTGGNVSMSASMPTFAFPRGGRVRSSTFALDAGDQYSEITVVTDS